MDLLTRDADALAHWTEVYDHLTRSRPGLVGAICNRAPAHVLRLSASVRLGGLLRHDSRRHQQAARGRVELCRGERHAIFGQQVGHRLANFLLELHAE